MNVAITFKDGSYITLSDIRKIEPHYEADEHNSKQWIALYSDQKDVSSLIDVNLIASWIVTRFER